MKKFSEYEWGVQKGPLLPWSIRRWIMPSEWRYRWRRFVGLFQRAWMGYASHDVWGFDHYLAGVMAKGLRDLAGQAHGCPHEFAVKYNPPDDGTPEAKYWPGDANRGTRDWQSWLYDKADWFEWYYLDEDGTSDDKGWITPGMSGEEKRRRIDTYHAKMEKFFNEVLPDFVKYYGNLWD